MPLVDLVGGDLPLPIGGGVAVGAPPSDVDVLVDRIPFWLAITADAPYQRETAKYSQDQFDAQPEAGEQTLAGWWTRSQMSFHGGAGLDYLDTSGRPDPGDRVRYKTSRNVDVWTPGTVSRLNGTTLTRAATAGQKVWTAPVDGGLLITARDSAVEVYDGVSWVTRNYGSTFPVKAFCTDGVNYYVGTADGVWSAPIAGTATATKLWSLPGSAAMALGWVKQRLVLGYANALYVLDGTGPTLPTAKLTHKLPSWSWTAICESPNGILGIGYAGTQAAIYRLEESDVNGVPTLGGGLCLLELPGGERVWDATLYLSSLLVLATDQGIRVCPFSSYWGTLTLGPITTDWRNPSKFTSLMGYDRFIYGGTVYNGETQLVRVDLSMPLDQQGHYAWAPDLVFPTGLWTEAPTSICTLSTGRMAIGVTGRGLVLEDAATNPSDSAWLQTSRVRMGTVERKHWLYGTLRGTFDATAPIGVSALGPDDATARSVYVATTSSERFSLNTNPSEYLALRFDLSEGAELGSYQLQGLPAGKRQRLVQLPVTISDYQRTRSGLEVGYPGWGRERLDAIEHLDSSGEELTVAAPALFAEGITGVIEKLTFVQATDLGDSTGDGTGGTLLILVRTTA